MPKIITVGGNVVTVANATSGGFDALSLAGEQFSANTVTATNAITIIAHTMTAGTADVQTESSVASMSWPETSTPTQLALGAVAHMSSIRTKPTGVNTYTGSCNLKSIVVSVMGATVFTNTISHQVGTITPVACDIQCQTHMTLVNVTTSTYLIEGACAMTGRGGIAEVPVAAFTPQTVVWSPSSAAPLIQINVTGTSTSDPDQTSHFDDYVLSLTTALGGHYMGSTTV